MADKQSAQGIFGHVAVINYFRVTYHSGYILKANSECTTKGFASVYNFCGAIGWINLSKSYNLAQIKKLLGIGFYDTVNIFACFAHNKPFLSSGRVCRSLP
jgi:hypothetical protein